MRAGRELDESWTRAGGELDEMDGEGDHRRRINGEEEVSEC